MIAKPKRIEDYPKVADACERVLATLVRGLGPYRDSVFLIGGLVPRYLVRDRPPAVPPHAGTSDVDVVIELEILADTEAYSTLEDNLKRMGFQRAINDKGLRLNWRWESKVDDHTTLALEFLADAPDIAGGRVQPLPTEGNISALNIPHSSMVFDQHIAREIKAELLGEDGVAKVTIRHADIVSFTCLKAFAFDHRAERKDAHDLVYCLEYGDGGVSGAAAWFRAALTGKHAGVVREALAILSRCFCDDSDTEGFRKDGPVAVAKFEHGDDEGQELREARVLRQRQVSEIVGGLLAALPDWLPPEADRPSPVRGREDRGR